MARKVFLSFLGATNYVASKYFIDDKEPIETRFVQLASLQYYCSDFSENDKIYIFTTDTAKKHNWENYTGINIHTKKETQTIGLRTELVDSKFKNIFEAVSIPEETSEEQIWDTFQIVFDKLEEYDEIFFDITHGFRSGPMLLMTLINYARFLKNITVKKIIYGAYEARDKDKNETKIWDLTNFALLQDWTSAADIFVNFGNAKRIQKLSANKIADKMQDIMRLFSTVRGAEIVEGVAFEKLKIEIQKFKNELEENDVFKPMIPIVQYMEQTLVGFSRNNVKNGFTAIKFCIDNDLIQQAFTLMQEMIISYILDLENEKYSDKISRLVLSSCFQITKERYESRLNMYEQKKTKKIDLENRLKEKLFESKYVTYFNVVYNKITIYRNDFNHAGTKGNAKIADDFYNEAIKLHEEIKSIIARIEIE